MFQLYAPAVGILLAVIYRKRNLKTVSALAAGLVFSVLAEGVRGYTELLPEMVWSAVHMITFYLGFVIAGELVCIKKENVIGIRWGRILVSSIMLCIVVAISMPWQNGKVTYQLKEENRTVSIDYDNARPIWNYLREDLGCTRAAAAGVLGNMFAESEYNPDAIQTNGVGHGIGQWSWSRWDGEDGLYAYAQNRGASWENMNVQLDFLKHEVVENDSMDVYYDGGFSRYRKIRKIEGENGSTQVFFYSFEYGNYVNYDAFLSDEFENNYATRSKRLTVAKVIYKDKKRFP